MNVDYETLTVTLDKRDHACYVVMSSAWLFYPHNRYGHDVVKIGYAGEHSMYYVGIVPYALIQQTDKILPVYRLSMPFVGINRGKNPQESASIQPIGLTVYTSQYQGITSQHRPSSLSEETRIRENRRIIRRWRIKYLDREIIKCGNRLWR